jgi:hypothetical protein
VRVREWKHLGVRFVGTVVDFDTSDAFETGGRKTERKASTAREEVEKYWFDRV